MTFLEQHKPTIKKYLLFTMITLLLLVVIDRTKHWASNAAYTKLSQDNLDELFRFSSSLEAVLKKYESIPHQLSIDEKIHDFLNHKSDAQKAQEMNLYLETVNSIHGSSDIYIMDSSANTIAASNWNIPKTFIGRNFSYRPYYTEAMQGKHGKYYALGTTSNKRGYYFSVPVTDAEDILGIVVLKIKLEDIEKQWESPWESSDTILAVTDEIGVIFISTRADWRLKSLGEIPPSDLQKMKSNRRYAGLEPEVIAIEELDRFTGFHEQPAQLITAKNKNGWPSPYLVQTLDMPIANWKVQAWSPTNTVAGAVRSALLIALSVYFLLVILLLFIFERFKNERQLEQARDNLEFRVKQRTSDLEASNARLQEEIDERQRAENTLKQTQEELIQAAKMAVLGQMSAGINHELNQPLTAIRSYAQNAQQFMQRGNQKMVENNLSEIISLTDNMASIVAQLKVFSRKQANSSEKINVMDSLKAASKMMSIHLARHGVDIQIQHDQEDYPVAGDLVRLEQVFVNLIANASQAMSQSETKKIQIRVHQQDQHIEICFRDTGPGITVENLKRVFDPFFTTKDISQGLGLGLSISYRIIEAMHGRFSVLNHPEGGAQFTIVLPVYTRATPSENKQENTLLEPSVE